MFCPKCGKAEQSPETYCRQCGIFLPDFTKPAKTRQSPEVHVTANIVLSSMTIVVSFTLSILIWAMLAFRPDTHPLIYVTAGLLFAMGIWHIQTLWRTLLLRKHLKQNMRKETELVNVSTYSSERFLEDANFEDVVPASVTERTTNQLTEKRPGSSQPEHKTN